MTQASFSARLLTWYHLHGRHHLPWQVPNDGYRVWISEIMLQQTQVATVIPFFERFLQRFPDIPSLAQAPLDHVLECWTGLGYYARARNIHQCAKRLMADFAGKLPQTLPELTTLPGIGRTTAAAICSLAWNLPEAILDGNVKRVLCRHYAIQGHPSVRQVELQLWELAEQLLPQQDNAAYTQAIMDLGATVCTRANPACHRCPLAASCQAKAQDKVDVLPTPKLKQEKPTRQTTFLLICCKDHILLERRPAKGIWGGLWSFPETSLIQAASIRKNLQAAWQNPVGKLQQWATMRHTFTHYHLLITPTLVPLAKRPPQLRTIATRRWQRIGDPCPVGLPTPVVKLLACLATGTVEG